MKFLIDESSGRKLFLFLKENDFDVKFIAEIMPRALDEDVLKFAEKENRILITNDKDFGELVFRLSKPSSGVILLRLKLDTPENRQTYIYKTLIKFPEKLKKSFIVITEDKIRIKKIK